MRKLLLVAAIVGVFLTSCSKQDSDPFAKVKPDESRFTKVRLVESLNEPMEIEVLNNKDVLIIERAGKIRLYQNETGNLLEVGFL
jgi:cytochrome c